MTTRQAMTKDGSALYQVTTNTACFGVVVEGGQVAEAAPIAGGAVGQSWEVVRGWYPKSAVSLIPPIGWTLQEGMGGWRAINRARLWSTNVFTVAHGGAERAVEAATELERKALAHQEELERQCVALRSYFSDVEAVRDG